MRLRRFLQVVVTAVTLVSPLATFAASVTTDPAGNPAPALAMPMLAALVMVLIGVGFYSIRGRSAGIVAGVAFVAGLSLLAGLGYAGVAGVVIKDGDCYSQSVHEYDKVGSTLTSQCPTLIKIDALDCDVLPPTVTCVATPPCSVGLILANGDSCMLPSCAC